MSYNELKNGERSTSSNTLPRFPTPAEYSSFVKQEIAASQFNFHETEPLEVTKVYLNELGNRGSVTGTLLNSGKNPGIVKSLLPNITAVPVVGEEVVTAEYNGQYYYIGILNLKGSVNENSIPGVTGNYQKNTKYGPNFESRKVKQIEIGEGCIAYEGRFGQTIHLDGHKNKPAIKISTHIDESKGNFRKENIDGDNSSIYLLSDGMSDMFDKETVEGKKVLIHSDGIFIKGREEIKINAPNFSVIKDEVKLGSRNAKASLVKGEFLQDFLITLLNDLLILAPMLAASFTSAGAAPAGTQLTTTVTKLQLKLQNAIMDKSFLSDKVKTI